MSFELQNWVCACLLIGLRVAPVFALAPPFSQIQAPTIFRVLFGLGVSVCILGGDPAIGRMDDFSLGNLITTGSRELLLGLIFVMAFQLMFGMLHLAGRTIDIQAGFGLALLIDPGTKGQVPLVGTMFSYGAAVVFFAMGGHHDLLGLLEASYQVIPLGGGHLPSNELARVAALLTALSLTSFGVAGGAILILFLADAAIALLSRTVPQMNVLVLGFQVKTILLFLVLPAMFGGSGALFARLSTITLEAIPGLL